MAIRRWHGGAEGCGLRIGIVVSRFNQTVTDALLAGALKALDRAGVRPDDIDIAAVPGVFEIPGTARQMGMSRHFDALICLGAVIRGETPHFHYIAAEVSRGIGQVSLDLGLPVLFGVLTTDSVAQAVARAGGKENKGAEAAAAAVEMAHLYKQIKGEKMPASPETG